MCIRDSRKIALAQRVSSPPVIDGILDDGSWSNAEINTDFFMFRPSNNGSARETHSTQVKVIYDDEEPAEEEPDCE